MTRVLQAALIILSSAAYSQAAGGTCPSAASYLNTSTNTLVTLSSLGVTSCYYVAASGSDSNDGLSEASGHPWLHAPGMPNCTSNCNTTPAAGTGFIFRGGDTWHFGASTSPATGGTLNPPSNGSSGSPIYYGVDQSWYTGGSWARPIFNGDNPTGISAVASCAHQIGSSNYMIGNLGSWQIFDSFEMLGICEGGAGTPEAGDYFRYGFGSNLGFYNLYIHGWTHVAYSCSGGSGICSNLSIFLGGSGSSTTPGESIWYTVVDGSDSDPAGVELGKSDYWFVAYNVFRYVSQLVSKNIHEFHDNLLEHWYCPGDQNDHPNLFEEVSEYSSTNAVYNNIYRHILSDSNSCPNVNSIVGFWPATCTAGCAVNTTEYIFNNLTYDEFNAEVFNLGQNGQSEGPMYAFNDTWENSSNTDIYTCQGTAATVTLANEHDITDNGSQYGCGSWQPTKTTNLLMTHATATSDGYTSGQTYAYSPAASGSPTVGAGTNKYSAYCGALGTAGLTDAQTACESDASYACSYNTSNHTVTCPARTVVARPASAAWDIGAYEYQAAAAAAGSRFIFTAGMHSVL